MKKILFRSMLVLGLATVAVACSDDDDDDNSNNGGGGSSAIVATWNVNKDTYRVTSSGVLLDEDSTIYAPGEWALQFTSDGKAISIENDGTGVVRDTSSYTFSGSVLRVIDNSGATPDTTVLNTSINGNSMVLSQTSTEVVGGVTISYDFKIYCSK